MIKNKNFFLQVVFFGPPASGKGTMVNKINQNFEFVHISTGDVLRSYIKQDTPEAKKVKEFMDKGELVPDVYNNQIISEKIQPLIQNKKSFILDGYPRNLNQCEFLDSLTNIDWIVHFQIDNIEKLIKRISGRMICSMCKRMYNESFNPPKIFNRCDIDNNELFKRQDDNPQIFKKRMEIDSKNSKVMIDYYQKKFKEKIIELNADDDLEKNYNILLKVWNLSDKGVK